MNRWPHSLRVKVQSTDGSSVERLLVGLRVRHQLRTYYSTLLGLTDTDGQIIVTGEQLAGDYAESQKDFPMDYKLPIAEWDGNLLVDLAGGQGFEQTRASALGAPLLQDRFRQMWREARNTDVASLSVAVAMDGGDAVALLTSRRSGPP